MSFGKLVKYGTIATAVVIGGGSLLGIVAFGFVVGFLNPLSAPLTIMTFAILAIVALASLLVVASFASPSISGIFCNDRIVRKHFHSNDKSTTNALGDVIPNERPDTSTLDDIKQFFGRISFYKVLCGSGTAAALIAATVIIVLTAMSIINPIVAIIVLASLGGAAFLATTAYLIPVPTIVSGIKGGIDNVAQGVSQSIANISNKVDEEYDSLGNSMNSLHV